MCYLHHYECPGICRHRPGKKLKHSKKWRGKNHLVLKSGVVLFDPKVAPIKELLYIVNKNVNGNFSSELQNRFY